MSKASKSGKPFQKFTQQNETGSQKKERIRQEKKVARKETQAYFARKKEEYKQYKAQGGARGSGHTIPAGESPVNKGSGGKSAYGKDAGRPTYAKDSRKPAYKGSGKPSYAKPSGYKNSTYGKSGGKRNDDARFDGAKEQRTFKPKGASDNRTDKPFQKKAFTPAAAGKFNDKDKNAPSGKITKPATGGAISKAIVKKGTTASPATKGAAPDAAKQSSPSSGQMPLNKFIAHAGVCARRDAADLVKSGKVMVNGQLITEPGFKVTTRDEVKVNGKQVVVRRNLVYILLNKPKDFITTTEDPQGRKTVLDIVKHATPERVYPIGRLDRNTTGVLLLTNDGELAQKLSHPSYEIKKIYEVTLDRVLLKKDFDTLLNGVTLEDGFIAPDVLAYADPKNKAVIGIEIHSGRNRIVRRIFESLGYDVRNLDRVMYANLTKKNVERGKWRFLSEKEVRLLKYLNASYTTKNKPAARG